LDLVDFEVVVHKVRQQLEVCSRGNVGGHHGVEPVVLVSLCAHHLEHKQFQALITLDVGLQVEELFVEIGVLHLTHETLDVHILAVLLQV